MISSQMMAAEEFSADDAELEIYSIVTPIMFVLQSMEIRYNLWPRLPKPLNTCESMMKDNGI